MILWTMTTTIQNDNNIADVVRFSTWGIKTGDGGVGGAASHASSSWRSCRGGTVAPRASPPVAPDTDDLVLILGTVMAYR